MEGISSPPNRSHLVVVVFVEGGGVFGFLSTKKKLESPNMTVSTSMVVYVFILMLLFLFFAHACCCRLGIRIRLVS